MSKTVRIIDRIVAALCFSALGASMVFFIIKWGSLPDEPGIHFDLETGEFDVYAAKVLGFYPHVIGALLLGAVVPVQRAAAKKSLGLRVDEEGDKIIRAELCLTLDLIMVFITLFCLNWSFAVSLQRGVDAQLMLFLRMHIFDIAAGGLIIAIVSARVHRVKAEKADSRKKRITDLATLHRLGRLIGWLMAAIGIVFLIAVWERLPNGDVADIYHGLAYFADLDQYLDKRLLLVPHAALILLLTLLEIASVRAYKKGNGPWVRFLASAKVFGGVYGFIAIIWLESEMRFSFGLLGFFAALVLIELIKLIVENKKEKE